MSSCQSDPIAHEERCGEMRGPCLGESWKRWSVLVTHREDSSTTGSMVVAFSMKYYTKKKKNFTVDCLTSNVTYKTQKHKKWAYMFYRSANCIIRIQKKEKDTAKVLPRILSANHFSL